MTTKRMKAAEVRAGWRDVLDHVRSGGEVIVEHYNRPVARIVPFEEPAVPRKIDVDPATLTRLDGREQWDPTLKIVWQRMTVGTTPDGTAVLITEERLPRPSTELAVTSVWAYESLSAAREDRDYQITRGYLPSDIAECIRDVSVDS